jgi:hypothetical protein
MTRRPAHKLVWRPKGLSGLTDAMINGEELVPSPAKIIPRYGESCSFLIIAVLPVQVVGLPRGCRIRSCLGRSLEYPHCLYSITTVVCGSNVGRREEKDVMMMRCQTVLGSGGGKSSMGDGGVMETVVCNGVRAKILLVARSTNCVILQIKMQIMLNSEQKGDSCTCNI